MTGLRFQSAHKLTSYLLAVAAVGTLASSGEVSLGTMVVFLVMLGLSWSFEPDTVLARWLDSAVWLLRAVVVGFFVLAMWKVVSTFMVEGVPGLSPVLDLVLFLLGYKFFQRRVNRDYLQIYVLSFLTVLAAAALAQSLFFSVGFAVYLVLAIWTLILLHLRREIEENYLVKHSPEAPSEKVEVERILGSRRVVGMPFFAATGLMALIIFAGAIATFIVVPRIGVGFFFGEGRRGRTMAGFDDQVMLGGHGVISNANEAVALRASVPRISQIESDVERAGEIARLYWRGTVYDTYLMGRWERSQASGTLTRLRTDSARSTRGTLTHVIDPMVPPMKFSQRLAGTERQEIDVVGLSHPVAFALDQPVAFELPSPAPGASSTLRFDARWGGEVALRRVRFYVRHDQTDDGRSLAGVRYAAYSFDARANPLARRSEPLSDIDPEDVQSYLALPAGLAPRIRDLALTVTDGKPNAAAKMVAVIEWLQKTHSYTTTLSPRDEERFPDPLEDFLFNQTAGHCEYFASAAAILLRASGVPTRYVNGFLGGEWNGLSKTITIRDNRAHSWVEAYLGELGWVRVDATPSGGGLPRMSRLTQLLEYIEIVWTRWVIDYDLSRQVDIVRRVGTRVGIAKPSVGGGRRWTPPSRKTVAIFATAAAVVYIAARVGWRLLRKRRARPSSWRPAAPRGGEPVVRLYHKALGRLARRGLPRRASETPHEFALRVRVANVRGGETWERLTDLYTSARFGRRRIDADVVADVARRLADLGAPLAVDPPPSRPPAPRPTAVP